jgi:hypothetical protein
MPDRLPVAHLPSARLTVDGDEVQRRRWLGDGLRLC